MMKIDSDPNCGSNSRRRRKRSQECLELCQLTGGKAEWLQFVVAEGRRGRTVVMRHDVTERLELAGVHVGSTIGHAAE